MQIECSELAWEMRMTEMLASRSAPNSRSAVPGTPIIPAPSMLSRATSSTAVTPLIGCRGSEVGPMSEPGAAVLNVFRIQIGIARWTAGDIVWG